MLDDADKLKREIEHWKKKYFAAVEQGETLEKQHAEAETLFRRLLIQLSLATEGRDKRLDALLEKLRSDARGDRKLLHLGNDIQQINDRASELEKERKGIAYRPVHEVLGELFQKVSLPGEHGKQVKAIAQKLAARDAPAQLPGILDDIQRLIDTLAQPPAAPADSASSKGLLGRLFGSPAPAEEPPKPNPTAKPSPTPAPIRVTDSQPAEDRLNPAVLGQFLDLVQVPEPLVTSVSEIRQGLKRATTNDDVLRLTRQLAQILSGATTTHPKTDTPVKPATLALAQEMLLELIDRLTLPEELASQQRSLRERIESDFAQDEIHDIIETLANLIGEAQSFSRSQREDLEGFLKLITDHLLEIDKNLGTTQEQQRDARASGRMLDTEVRAQVEGIQDSVAKATQLEELKLHIAKRLDAIRGHLKTFNDAEERRHESMQSEMSALRARLGQLETESQRLREHLKQQQDAALRDALTGLYNRHAYEDHLTHLFSRWQRDRKPLVIAVWDIDHFKRINDEYGHQAGDKALKVVAKMLNSRLRQSDYVARYGGEEFVTLIVDCALAEAIKIADLLRASIEKTEFHYSGQQVPITISCGLAEFKEGDTPEGVFKRADDALYHAKKNGRNRYATELDL
ncbi:MAG: diguanylate cyclase [Pseudomonadota bacterium]